MIKIKFLKSLPTLPSDPESCSTFPGAKGDRGACGCPPATQDLKLNTENRNKAIKEEHIQYGPLNLADEDYWERLGKHWGTTPSVVKESRCGNCVAFDVSPRMLECLPGPVSEPIEDAEGKLGYCWMHHFKCHSARSCYTWAGGGPIGDDEKSMEWQKKSGMLEEKKDYVSKQQACVQEDGDSGTHVVYKRKGKKLKKIGCTSNPEGYKTALRINASEKVNEVSTASGAAASIETSPVRKKKKKKIKESIVKFVVQELDAVLEKKERKKTVKQDPDVKDKPGTQPAKYYKGLSKADKKKRADQFRRGAEKSDDDPSAYKEAPGDKKKKKTTKPSKHTTKFKQMFGEEFQHIDESILEQDLLLEIGAKAEKALKNKAKKANAPLGALKTIYRKGLAAWRTGHRPGASQHAWAMARVNSVLTGGGARKVDAAQWKQIQKFRKRKKGKKKK